MIILDTDTLSIAQYPDSEHAKRFDARIAELPDSEPASTTIISYEEQTRGWFAYMAKAHSMPQQIDAYDKLHSHLLRFRRMNVLRFDHTAAVNSDHLRSLKLHVGTMGFKIAAIALANSALLLTRSLKDFRKIPNLRVEDWTQL
jgi:tRNA(fMet)-specific endonuclease VapC